MSQEAVELIRGGFAAFEQGDLSQMLDLTADDLVTYRADPRWRDVARQGGLSCLGYIGRVARPLTRRTENGCRL